MSKHELSDNNERSAKRGVDISRLDKAVKPTDDFYRFANGAWLKSNPIPDHLESWGSFSILSEGQRDRLKDLLDEASSSDDYTSDPTIKKVVDMYKLSMDVDKLNREGTSPLLEELSRINGIKTRTDLISSIAYFHTIGVNVLWGIGVDKDLRGGDLTALYMGQGVLGMPDRDYYLDDDKKKERVEYRKLIERVLMLFGDSAQSAKKQASVIIDIETKLAERSMTKTERRDLEAQYNKMSIDKLKELSPRIDWVTYFSEAGISDPKELILMQPKFIKRVHALWNKVTLENWKMYIRWQLALSSSSHLSEDLSEATFDFYGKIISGTKEQRPLWQRRIATIDSLMGEALGKLYVAKYFPPEAKEKIRELVDNLKDVLEDRIKRLEWMSGDTKQKALEKLSKFTTKLGYPDEWRNYNALEIKNDYHIKNIFRARLFEYKRELSKLGKPVDRSEWHMSPQTVNAYYNPLVNEIVFPAGILQPPFFGIEQDDALNYGAIGSVIGHEITHGFDDKGSTFDGDGNMENWWTKEDKSRFEELANMLAGQYEDVDVIDGLRVKGQLTSGENIADLGGLNIALDAYKQSLEQGKSFSGDIDGLTPMQRFFIAYAQLWGMNIREETVKARLTTDFHSPATLRVLIPLGNINEFYQSFDCQESDVMYRSPKDRVYIW